MSKCPQNTIESLIDAVAGTVTVTKTETLTTTINSVEPLKATNSALHTSTITTTISGILTTTCTTTSTTTATPFQIFDTNGLRLFGADISYDGGSSYAFMGNASASYSSNSTFFLSGKTVYSLYDGTTFATPGSQTFWVSFEDPGYEEFNCDVMADDELVCVGGEGGRLWGEANSYDYEDSYELAHGTRETLTGYFDCEIVGLYVRYLCG